MWTSEWRISTYFLSKCTIKKEGAKDNKGCIESLTDLQAGVFVIPDYLLALSGVCRKQNPLVQKFFTTYASFPSKAHLEGKWGGGESAAPAWCRPPGGTCTCISVHLSLSDWLTSGGCRQPWWPATLVPEDRTPGLTLPLAMWPWTSNLTAFPCCQMETMMSTLQGCWDD